nr:PTS transporter subunit EIIC [Bacilli bacterium]
MLAQLQRIGKALMLPIAILPVAGLLLRLGQPDTLNIPFMASVGNAVFSNLPILFAIGIAVGFAKNNHGLAGLAGFLSYTILSSGADAINSSINLGYLGAIVGGLLTGWLFNVFSKKDSKYLSYVGGSRGLAVILIMIVSFFLSLLFGAIWPSVQNAFNTLGQWLTETGAYGAGIYGLVNRLLIPFGLHHVINTYIWFVYGNFHGVTGDLNRFFAGDPTAGGYMAGMFPIFMFGLPGAALAMILAARKENRKVVAGVLGSAAFTSFFTGITEPIEFSFMFIAPFLYIIHAVLTALSMFICFALGIKDGFTFSAGFLDYVLNRNYATHGYWLIPIGIVFGLLYFVIFYFSIKFFDLKTPGRELITAGNIGNSFILDEYQVTGGKEAPKVEANAVNQANTSADDRGYAYLQALGGKDNIKLIEACMTRLRLELQDVDRIDEARLSQLGASGCIKLNKTSAQVIVGTVADLLTDEIKQYL